tara:strand:- start:501 stop:1193 length:693 start_codon:yes stop_codon:yes gene_type:complete
MAIILCLETSSKNCSVSISNNGKIQLLKEELDEGYCHGEKLHILIKLLLQELSLSFNNIDALCFSSGPGSYTGLRIGAAAVKGLAMVIEKPVISISTLKAMAWGFFTHESLNNLKEYLLCPVVDSRQGEVYMAIYDNNLSIEVSPFACDVNSFSLTNYLNKCPVYFFGSGTYKLETYQKHKNANFSDTYIPSSINLGVLAQESFDQNNFVDIAYFEPLYLKPFIATNSKK